MHALAANGDVLKSVRATLAVSFVLLTVVRNQWLIILYLLIFSPIMEGISAFGNMRMRKQNTRNRGY